MITKTIIAIDCRVDRDFTTRTISKTITITIIARSIKATTFYHPITASNNQTINYQSNMNTTE